MRTALASDPELLAVFDSMDAVLQEDAWARSDDLLALGDRRNAHLVEAGWVIDRGVMRQGQQVQVYIKVYEVRADVSVDVAGPRRVQDPPPDVGVRAAALQTDLFGRSDRAVLPADYPTWIEPASGLNRVD